MTIPSGALIVSPLAATTQFVYRTVPQRIVFGAGTRRRIAEEAALAGIDRAMVISTPEQAGSVNELASIGRKETAPRKVARRVMPVGAPAMPSQ